MSWRNFQLLRHLVFAHYGISIGLNRVPHDVSQTLILTRCLRASLLATSTTIPSVSN